MDFIRITLVFLLSFPGFAANLFILTNSFTQMCSERKLQPANVLLTCNSLNNLAVEIFIFAVFLLIGLKVCPSAEKIAILTFLWELCANLQMWAIALICLFYCFMIVPGSGRPFLWLKHNFSLVAVAIMLAGTVCSLAVTVVDMFREGPSNKTHDAFNQSCFRKELPDNLLTMRTSITILMHISVFLLMACSSGTLVAHLSRHLRRMTANGSAVGGVRQEGITRVVIMIVLLALEFGACTIARHILYILSLDETSVQLIWNYSLVSLTLCSLIPITLIAGINILRQRATTLCHRALQNVESDAV